MTTAPQSKTATHFIPTFHGKIECRIAELRLVDFYRSPQLMTAGVEAASTETQKHTSRIFKLKR